MTVAVAVLLSVAVPAFAQPPIPRPIRLEGYWERTRAEREVIGEITIDAENREPRRFGVTALQAYKPEEEGMQIFRFSDQRPATLLARGDGVGRFWAAPRDRKVIVFGTYNPGPGTFIVGSVETEGSEPRR
jgi:hypothetical protein